MLPQNCHPHTQAILTFLTTAYPEAAKVLEAAILNDFHDPYDGATADEFVRKYPNNSPEGVKSLLVWAAASAHFDLPHVDFLKIQDLLEDKTWETLCTSSSTSPSLP